jgi:hypothetical protein
VISRKYPELTPKAWHYVFLASGPTPEKPGEKRISTIKNEDELSKMGLTPGRAVFIPVPPI